MNSVFLLSNLLFLLYSQFSEWYLSNVALTRRLEVILSSCLFLIVCATLFAWNSLPSLSPFLLVHSSRPRLSFTSLNKPFLTLFFFTPGRIRCISTSLLLYPVYTPIPSVNTLGGNCWLMYLPP